MTTPPRALSISKVSPFYNKAAIQIVDKVFCDGVWVPQCVYYNMDKGECRGKDERGNWLPMVHGEITVTTK